MNDTNELLVINCEERFLLVRDADSRWSVLAGLVDLSGHLSAGLQTGPKASMLPQCFNAKMLALLPEDQSELSEESQRRDRSLPTTPNNFGSAGHSGAGVKGRRLRLVVEYLPIARQLVDVRSETHSRTWR